MALKNDFVISWNGDEAIAKHTPTGIVQHAVGGTKTANLMAVLDGIKKRVECAERIMRSSHPA